MNALLCIWINAYIALKKLRKKLENNLMYFKVRGTSVAFAPLQNYVYVLFL